MREGKKTRFEGLNREQRLYVPCLIGRGEVGGRGHEVQFFCLPRVTGLLGTWSKHPPLRLEDGVQIPIKSKADFASPELHIGRNKHYTLYQS